MLYSLNLKIVSQIFSISKITIKSNDGQNFLIWNNEELLNSLKSLDQKNGYYLVVDNVDIEYIDYQMEIKYSITEGDSVYENMIYFTYCQKSY